MPHKDPEVRKSYRQHYYQRTKERQRVYAAEYRKTHKELIEEIRQKFLENHPHYERNRSRTDRKRADRRRFYHRHKERINRERKKYHAKRYLDNKQVFNQRTILWQKENPDKLKVIRKRTYYKNHKANLQRVARWAKAHPEQRRQYDNHARIKRLAAPGSHTLAEWQAKKALYSYRCFYCGKQPKRLEREHMVPLSRGGRDDISNIVPACLPCNRRKHTLTAEQFAHYLTVQLRLAL